MKKVIGYLLLILLILAITFGIFAMFYFGADLSIIQSMLYVCLVYALTAILTGILYLIIHLIL